MNHRQAITVLILTAALTGCVQSHTMATHRVSDPQMGCTETAQRIGELDAIKNLTLTEKNSKNILAGVLFLPAVSGNRRNAQDTIAAVNQRKQVLADIYQANECVSEIPQYSVDEIKRRINANQVLELQTPAQ